MTILTENLSEQRIFDHVVLQLALQGGPSKVNGACAYRGDDGRKCGVGFLLTDKEVNWLGNASAIGGERAPKRLRPYMLLLTAIQGVHDIQVSDWRGMNAWRPSEIADMLERVADDRGLSKGVLYSAFPRPGAPEDTTVVVKALEKVIEEFLEGTG